MTLEELAAEHLTPRQLQAWRLHHRGLSQRTIALHMGISRSSVRNTLEAADLRLRKAAAKENA